MTSWNSDSGVRSTCFGKTGFLPIFKVCLCYAGDLTVDVALPAGVLFSLDQWDNQPGSPSLVHIQGRKMKEGRLSAHEASAHPNDNQADLLPWKYPPIDCTEFHTKHVEILEVEEN